MKFNKCVRCGSFFASEDSVCPHCHQKDEIDKSSIKKYLANNDIPQNAEALSFYSGVSLKNINRYLNTKEFSSLKKSFENPERTNSGFKSIQL